ncbi:type II secretion system minor pseudopilin GspK [Pseudothauera rhizosphaerae]|nr:type II secretion system minor pseudopilin GspK [Pseudothauera rhizosphaerae]
MAVISVLVVVAVVAVMAAALMARQATAIHAAQAEQTLVQARWLLRGEISRAQVVLRAEAQREPSTRLDGLWSRPITGKVVGSLDGEPARVFSEIIDEQSKFNLRNLLTADEVDPTEAATFLRLCTLVGVPPEQARHIVRRVVVSLVAAERRVEAAGSPSPARIERQAQARAVATQLGLPQPLPSQEEAPRLRTLDDLLSDHGIEHAAIERLRPYATILPIRTRINANTTGPEVLAAGVPGLPLERARALVQTRDRGQWFLNRGDIINRLQMRETLDPAELRVGVTSRWFRVSSALRTPHTTVLMQALLHDNKESLPEVVWLREGA